MLWYVFSLICSGGSSIEADKALPHPQSPRSNTLQYFYLQYSKMRCIVKENNIFKSKKKLVSKFWVLNPFSTHSKIIIWAKKAQVNRHHRWKKLGCEAVPHSPKTRNLASFCCQVWLDCFNSGALPSTFTKSRPLIAKCIGMQWISSAVPLYIYCCARSTPNDTLSMHASWIETVGFFSRALPFRRKPRRRRVADAGRLELQHFRTTVPHRRRRLLRRSGQYLYRMM